MACILQRGRCFDLMATPLRREGSHETWSISYVPTIGPVPVFRARARVATSYEALSQHYYGSPDHAAEIAAAGTPPGAIVPVNTWVTVGSALGSLDSRERQIAVAHQASAFTEWMARACRPSESTVVADWINPVPFAELLKRVTWRFRFSAIYRVERLDAPNLAKDFESLRVYFIEYRVFRQLEYTMEQIVGAAPGALRTIGAFCLGDGVVVEGPRPSGRTGSLAELIAHEVIHRIQCCQVGDTRRWLRNCVQECHRNGLNPGISGYRQNRYEQEAYGVARGCRSVTTETTDEKAWWVRSPSPVRGPSCARDA